MANKGTLKRGDHVATPDGNGVVLMPETPGWDRLTILVADHKTLPYQRDYYASDLALRSVDCPRCICVGDGHCLCH